MIRGFSKKNNWVLLIALLVFLLLLPFIAGFFGNAWIRILAFSLLYIMLALGLNIVVGYAGLLDLGYVAFYAVGAYFYALLTSPHLHNQFIFISQMFPVGFGLNTIGIVLMAAFVAAFFGIMLGFPILKLRGDYLAIVTLGFGEIIRIFLNNLNSPVNLTNGPQGIGGIEPITILGTDFSNSLSIGYITFPSVQLHYYLFLIFALIIIVISFRLENSRIGRAWLAIREDEIAAKSMGINTRNMKLLAFALGASFGGISGAMFAAFQGFVSPESFVLMESIIIVAMVVLGGLGNVYGVILGAILLYAIPEILRLIARPIQDAIFGFEIIAPEALRMLLFGTSMVLIMLYRPQGIFPRVSKQNG
jgi:branched-chain amino acid transport system permease protein